MDSEPEKLHTSLNALLILHQSRTTKIWDATLIIYKKVNGILKKNRVTRKEQF